MENDLNIKNSLLSCQEVYSEKKSFLNLKSSALFEISLVISGMGIHRVLDNDVPCKKGDIFIVPADVPHGYFIENAGGELILRQLFFFLDDWFGGDIADRSDYRYCYGTFRESLTLGYAVLDAHTEEKIKNIWDIIEYELQATAENRKDAIGSMLSYLIITVARYLNSSEKNLSLASYEEWNTVSTAIRMVREEYGNCSLTQEEIASRLYISKSQFSRIFKKLTGSFFADYIRDVRIKNVCRLLKKSDANVEDIAKECGFKNMPSFYKNFSLQMGMTPKEYRQSVSVTDHRSIEYMKLLKGKKVMEILNKISENLQNGRAKLVKELVQQALDEGVKPADILSEGLLEGMSIIGEKFKNNEVYVPEVLVASRAMNMGAQVLKPHLAEAGVVASGKVCIGTVQGDLHDIGKNLVKMMMEAKGLEVIDLGTDVAAETFVQTAMEQNCQVICCSALLTTTMYVMADVVKVAEAAGIRDKVKIMIGGAPVTDEYCKEIGADCYTLDATSAAEAAAEFCKNK